MSRSPAHEVDACRELSLGSHIATPRGAYVHHGIDVGNGLVVHYGGPVPGLRAGPIEVVSIEQFTQGRLLHVVLASSPYFSGAEIVQRALSRVGEDRYHVLTNNCEHFCEWQTENGFRCGGQAFLVPILSPHFTKFSKQQEMPSGAIITFLRPPVSHDGEGCRLK